jgi:hypothetical protein
MMVVCDSFTAALGEKHPYTHDRANCALRRTYARLFQGLYSAPNYK